MMKLILILSIYFVLSFAQSSIDGYHIDDEVVCQTGECLYVGNQIYEVIPMRDQNNHEYLEINSRDGLLDIFYRGMQEDVCYAGKDIQKLRTIIYELEDNSNLQWARGSHDRVKNAYFTKLDLSGSAIKVIWETDFIDFMDIEDNYSIPTCE